jgi:tetratricopeptide (TPR) repeat protein
MAQEKMYKAALEAIDQGETARARDLFTRLLRSDSSKAEYWLWMSTLVETPQERVYCLESALRVDPNNEAAKRGLIILGAKQAGDDITPVPPIKRHWEKETEKIEETAKPAAAPPKPLLKNPLALLAFGIMAIFICGGVAIGTYILTRPKPTPFAIYQVSPFPTRTPIPSDTPTVTRTIFVHTLTPTEIGPTPLWVFLTETYTPMPIYVNTPHPAIEAYRAAIRSYERSDWPSMLNFLQQATSVEPRSPDLYYYTGEAYRLMDNPQDALIAYGQALKIDPYFAPAYVGRALAYEAIDPHADVEGEFNYALQYDPYYVDAYLQRARVRIQHNNPTGALEDLQIAENIFPTHPMVFILRAQAYLKMGDLTAAMDNAQKGHELDFTSLPAYLTLAQVYLAQQDFTQALNNVKIYLRYIQNDVNAWEVVTQAQYLQGNLDQAISASDAGIAANPENAPIWYYRGMAHLALGDSHTAVNDLISAVNLDQLNFDYSIALAKALWADGRLDMAARQFDSAENLASTNTQLAFIYYNRGQIYEQAQKLTQASNDYGLLLALPPDQVPQEWRNFAQERWLMINPPTPTEIPTSTREPTETSAP